jgi:hypothetical protein
MWLPSTRAVRATTGYTREENMARRKVERKLREAAQRAAVQQQASASGDADASVSSQKLPKRAAKVGATAIVVSGVPAIDPPVDAASPGG